MKISVSVRIERDIEAVWQGWNDPDSIMQWNAASDDWHTSSSRVDLRVGGSFSHHMAAKDGSTGFDFEGTYTLIEAPYLLSFSMADGRIVTVGFSEELGGTTVTEEFDTESLHSSEQQRAGWQSILDNFKRFMESGG